jgi:hypothetical protein
MYVITELCRVPFELLLFNPGTWNQAEMDSRLLSCTFCQEHTIHCFQQPESPRKKSYIIVIKSLRTRMQAQARKMRFFLADVSGSSSSIGPGSTRLAHGLGESGVHDAGSSSIPASNKSAGDCPWRQCPCFSQEPVIMACRYCFEGDC